MKHIRFTRNDGPYSPGDVAGFVPDVAEIYIQRRTAEIAFPELAPARVQTTPAPDMDASAAATAPAGDSADPAVVAEMLAAGETAAAEVPVAAEGGAALTETPVPGDAAPVPGETATSAETPAKGRGRR